MTAKSMQANDKRRIIEKKVKEYVQLQKLFVETCLELITQGRGLNSNQVDNVPKIIK